MKHLFSESAVWKTTSEFVSPDGKISRAEGESVISVLEAEIMNESWAELDGVRRTNNYKITPVSPSELLSESLNPELGKQIGTFHIDRNAIFSKFKIENTTLSGYEIIRREGDTCYAQGALYDSDSLVNTWSATMKKQIKFTIKKVTTDYPYDLLLLADETKEGIHKYLFESEVYVAKLPDSSTPIGVFCLYPVNADTIEIMNIAVSEQYQNTGIGSRLLAESLKIAKEQGYKEIIVGTADCGLKQIHFYEKNGFVKYDIRKNYFTDIYDAPIYENGIQLKDMVMLRKAIIHKIQE